ncbi:MAG: deoxyribodipyrimidine photo-lyase [bacterium]
MAINKKRVLQLTSHEYNNGPVVYWMNRDMRVHDNWAFVYAQELAREHKTSVVVIYNLVSGFLGGGSRQLDFKLGALRELEQEFEKYNIPFAVVSDKLGTKSTDQLLDFFKEVKAGAVVTDFSPLRISRKWVDVIRKKITVPLYGVDAHNIVPCWIASPKQEFGAYTLRPKLHTLIPEFLDAFPKVVRQEGSVKVSKKYSEWKKISTDKSVSPIAPGEAAAKKQLNYFFANGLVNYDNDRNDPNSNAQSGLSPYLHYGNIPAQRIILEFMRELKKKDVRSLYDNAFFEELVVRKELADNFCFYNENYDSPEGFPDWSKKSWEKHKDDKREYVYTKKQFEHAKTHDALWNAAQMEMVITGKMHGYMRMYWAKKILEWTPDAEAAMKIAIYLNDTYELDGRDPNGYAGIAWSIGGTHDRAWFERPVFGQIRYMNANGCAKKFDVEAYCQKWLN